MRALERWLAAAGITDGPVFRRIWRAKRAVAGEPPPLPRLGADALTAQSVALVVQARAVAAGFGQRELGGHSLKRGALTTGMDRGVHPAKLKRSAAIRASTCSANTSNSAICSRGIRSAGVL